MRRALLPGCICLSAYLTAAGAAAAETQLYFGDVHLHSSYSTDAYATGNTTVTPDQAYRFARGIPVLHPALGAKVKIGRPLDFLAVTDHAVNLGIDEMIKQKDPVLQATEWGRTLIAQGAETSWSSFMRFRPPQGKQEEMMAQVFSPRVRSAAWDKEIAAAENNNQPGTFTTLIGWEWTGMVEGRNLHRCILTASGADVARKFIPYSMEDSVRPEDLWNFLEKTQRETGADFVSIPHNSNLSGGLMFDLVDSDGRPIDRNYANRRARWETVVEITQTKGTSEVRPELAPTDEFAEFEIRRKLLAGAPTPPSEGDYVRSALLRGLAFGNSIGVNPYQFGVIGATDNHVGMSSVDENDFVGKLAADIRPQDRYQPKSRVIFPAWEMSASGLTAVWATANTREAIFQAFKRKEVYGTTGTRIRLRVFGGYEFSAADAKAGDVAIAGYRKGVPMGSDLLHAPRGKAPALLIQALKDPQGANLDRVQVIKGWVDRDGKAHDRIFDVVWSDNRKPGSDGKLPPVGNTVDLATAQYANTIGATQFTTLWTDPEFDPMQSAFYYVRVIEIPTPRHSLFDALALGIEVSETKQPATLQERAYSSPIWYQPKE